MRIGMIAPPWFPLPPKGYGGIELVVSLLTEGLVRAATRSPCSPAATRRRGRETVATSSAGPPASRSPRRHLEIMHGLEAYSRAREFDLIHDHDGFACARHGRASQPCWSARRCVATLHGPADPAPRRAWPRCATTCASSPSPSTSATGSPTCTSSAPSPTPSTSSSYPFSPRRTTTSSSSGRMIADKGAHTAIEVARRLGARLILAGKVNEEPEREYFADAGRAAT